MKMMLRTCALLLAVGVLVSTSVASAIFWSGNKPSPGFYTFTDPHGHKLDIGVNWWITNTTITAVTNGSTVPHKAASICAVGGVPTVVQNGPGQTGTNWSIAACPFGTTIIGGAGATHP